jgi:retron-type reverse transcriptase
VGALDAVDQRTGKLQCGRDHYVVEADSKGFFATLDHDGLSRRWAERSEDRAFLGLIGKWVRAGIRDTPGAIRPPGRGTPHGGGVSPVLSNGSRHYGLDLGFEKGIKPQGRGEAGLLRYADDYSCAVESQAEAERFYAAVGSRREKFGLTLAAEKTRILPFHRHQPPGQGRFECLGVEGDGGRDRAGKAHLQRRTARAKLRASRQRVPPWGRENRPRRLRELCT